MFSSKKILLSLRVILSLGLVLPFCFHTGISQAFTPAHQHEMQAHGEHAPQSDSDEEQCTCGHDLVKVYQKSKEAVSAHSISFLPAAAALVTTKKPLPNSFQSLSIQNYRYFISDSSPPLHLLFGVFLN